VTRTHGTPTDARTARLRIGRVLRYVLGAAYVVFFVESYRTEGFPFDRERVLLWIAAALTITGIGRPWRWSATLVVDLVPFAVLLYAYDYAYVIAKGVGRTVVYKPLVAADRLLFFGHVPSVWLQAHLAHQGQVAWWELGVSIVYASHFVVPLATAGVARWRSRQLFRQWAV